MTKWLSRFISITIRCSIWGLKEKLCDYSKILAPNNTLNARNSNNNNCRKKLYLTFNVVRFLGCLQIDYSTY